jgi:hypothetical protein
MDGQICCQSEIIIPSLREKLVCRGIILLNALAIGEISDNAKLSTGLGVIDSLLKITDRFRKNYVLSNCLYEYPQALQHPPV